MNNQQIKLDRVEAWMDHEVFTPESTEQSFGWDWFAIQFDNNSELMVYQLRDKQRTILKTASGSFVDPNGQSYCT